MFSVKILENVITFVIELHCSCWIFTQFVADTTVVVENIPIIDIICDPTWDLVPLGGNVCYLVDELYFLVVKTICKYSFWNLRYASLKLPMSPNFKTP